MLTWRLLQASRAAMPSIVTAPASNSDDGTAVLTANSWGLVAPANTPREIIERAEGVVVPFVRAPATAARFLEMGLDPGELGASAFQLYIASEKDKLAGIVRRAGIQPE